MQGMEPTQGSTGILVVGNYTENWTKVENAGNVGTCGGDGVLSTKRSPCRE